MTSIDFALPAGEPTSTAAPTPVTGVDVISHPAHYNQGRIEVLEAMRDWKLDALEANVVKYVARHRYKDGVKDLRKALFYLSRKLFELEGAEAESALVTIVREAIPQADIHARALAAAEERATWWADAQQRASMAHKEAKEELAKEEEKHRRAESLIVELKTQLRAYQKAPAPPPPQPKTKKHPKKRVTRHSRDL